jgi:hypothetical protein
MNLLKKAHKLSESYDQRDISSNYYFKLPVEENRLRKVKVIEESSNALEGSVNEIKIKLRDLQKEAKFLGFKDLDFWTESIDCGERIEHYVEFSRLETNYEMNTRLKLINDIKNLKNN